MRIRPRAGQAVRTGHGGALRRLRDVALDTDEISQATGENGDTRPPPSWGPGPASLRYDRGGGLRLGSRPDRVPRSRRSEGAPAVSLHHRRATGCRGRSSEPVSFKRHAVGQGTPLALLLGLAGVHLKRKGTQGGHRAVTSTRNRAGGRSGPGFHTPGEVGAPHPGGHPGRVLTFENRVPSEKSRWRTYRLLECPNGTAATSSPRGQQSLQEVPLQGTGLRVGAGELCPGGRLTGQAPTDWPRGPRQVGNEAG